ncbi:uncharacterized protein UDID_05923 [Ustilago sp. UG-2017a]|nr:uncharacterized protein UDID_05923 [Ustilago sp. UG-2017a]
MASAFTKLFLPSHRKRSSNTSSARRQEASRSRFSTSSTFDLRHSIPEESTPSAEATIPSFQSTSTLTVQHLNDHVSAPISDATLRRRSLAIEAGRSSSKDFRRPFLPHSYSAQDVTSPLDSNTDAEDAYPTSSESSPPPPIDDDDDIDSNQLFLQLSEDPCLANDWNNASLTVIPLARTLNDHHALHKEDLLDPHFIALHAFAPSKLYKHQFVSVRSLAQSSASTDKTADRYDWSHVTLTATIESDQKSVSITETVHAPSSTTDAGDTSASTSIPSAATKRKVNIASEITIYRTQPKPALTASSTESAFRVTSRPSQTKDGISTSTKVRVVSVELPIVHRRVPSAGASSSHDMPAEQSSRPSDTQEVESTASISDLILDHIPPKRLFAQDLVILAQPSASSPRLSNALSNAFDVLFSAAHQFTASFVYVKGFDSYNAHRIRRGIWFKAWKAFEERIGSEHVARLSVEAFHRIKSLLENVVMGLVHTKMYGPIQDQLLDADLVTDDVLNVYNASSVSLADFGVQNFAIKQRPSRLADAIAALSRGLRDDDGAGIDEALASGHIDILKSKLYASRTPSASEEQPGPSECIQTNLGLIQPSRAQGANDIADTDLHRRTPLQILQTLRAVIDEIGWAAERLHQSSIRGSSSQQERPLPLGTDDLLPILSFLFVRARPSRLCSMLYYARAFQLTDTATSPELQWVLVTCDAVIAYLRTDPLRLCRRRSSSSILVEPLLCTGSQSRSASSSNNNDVLFAPSMSPRSRQGSAAGSSLQATAVMAPPSALDSSSTIEATPLQSPQSPYLPVDVGGDYLSTSGSNSYFQQRLGDVSAEHGAYASSESSPPLQAEGFKLPGLPASVSSRCNSRILQQRPTSVFSLSEDGDVISLGPDVSVEALDRRLSTSAAMTAAATQQSPSRRVSMRERSFSSSSSSTTHNDVQIRPQIVRTIKRSQAGSLYTSNRLERTSSNGSNASSSNVHVRVVGSPSLRAREAMSGRDSPLINASPSKTDRRRSFDSWTAFSLFSSTAPQSAANITQHPNVGVDSDTTSGTRFNQTGRSRSKADNATDASATSAGSTGTVGSSGWFSWGTDAISSTSRRNSVSTATTTSRAPSAFLSRVSSTTTTTTGPEDDVNCQPEGVETPIPPTKALHESTNSSRPSIADLSSLDWPSAPDTDVKKEESGAGMTSLPSTVRSKRRYRGRFLSTSSATLAGSAEPLRPQIDRSSTSSADLARLGSKQRQSVGSLDALRATLDSSSAMSSGAFALKDSGGRREELEEEVPEMIPYGRNPLALFGNLEVPSPVAEQPGSRERTVPNTPTPFSSGMTSKGSVSLLDESIMVDAAQASTLIITSKIEQSKSGAGTEG